MRVGVGRVGVGVGRVGIGWGWGWVGWGWQISEVQQRLCATSWARVSKHGA